jgi:uncharacterized protein Usg
MAPLLRQLEDGFGLTTATILYHRPDHLWLLQTYVWQDYDLFPEFPELAKFLTFWENSLDGPLHSVSVSHSRLITPTNFLHRSLVVNI